MARRNLGRAESKVRVAKYQMRSPMQASIAKPAARKKLAATAISGQVAIRKIATARLLFAMP